MNKEWSDSESAYTPSALRAAAENLAKSTISSPPRLPDSKEIETMSKYGAIWEDGIWIFPPVGYQQYLNDHHE